MTIPGGEGGCPGLRHNMNVAFERGRRRKAEICRNSLDVWQRHQLLRTLERVGVQAVDVVDLQ